MTYKDPEYMKKWRLAHPEQEKERQKKWYLSHREQRNESIRKWRHAHREQRNKSARKYYLTHRGQANEHQRKYRLTHPEQVKEYSRKYYLAHSEQLKESQRKWSRRYHRKWRFGITLEQTKTLWIAQDKGKCVICKKQLNWFRMHVDHDHKTGKVRGLLCGNCNLALGLLKDSKESLLSAIHYLEGI